MDAEMTRMKAFDRFLCVNIMTCVTMSKDKEFGSSRDNAIDGQQYTNLLSSWSSRCSNWTAGELVSLSGCLNLDIAAHLQMR
jgi:hypothetical protein